MNKKVTYLAILMVPIFIMAKLPERLRSGAPLSSAAPVSSSGAPNEVTCAASGCHDDGKINSGSALLKVKFGDDITSYVPGKVYPITVKIADSGVNRFGFQIVALKNSDNMNAGVMSVMDLDRTQIVSNDIALQDRKYVTYTNQGTEPSAPGEGEWTMNWTAPDKSEGPVTLYIASVSANNDNTDKGDHVYTTKLTLTPDAAAAIDDHSADMHTTVLFNNSSKELSVGIQLLNEKQVQCAVYTIEGRLVKSLFDERTAATEKKITLDIPHGLYLVKLSAGQIEKTTKIIVQ